MTVGRCMTKNPVTVGPDVTVPEAQAIMRREKIRRLPVLDKHAALVGIVTAGDLIHAAPSGATVLDVYELNYLLSKLEVRKVMQKKVLTATEDMTVEDAARMMVDNDISGLPVLRGEKLVGIVTESDLFELFLELFGSRHTGLRVTVLLPEKQGELGCLGAAIAEAGGNIISFATFDGEDPSNNYCTMKIQGMDRAAIERVIGPLVEEITDIRS